MNGRQDAPPRDGAHSDELRLEQLIDIEVLQTIQDAFAKATGVASIITHPDGRPITKPTNFCRLCSDIIRQTPKGLANCMISDAVIGHPNPDGPIVQHCLSGGLWDGGASITVGDRHIANWLVGQVLDQTVDLERMLAYAREIGADQESFREAMAEVTKMPKAQFEQICQALYLIAGQISTLAFQNMQLLLEVQERGRVEARLRAANEELSAANEEICAADEELRQNFEVLQKTESDLRESEGRFREVLETVQLCTVLLDPQGDIAFCNEYLLRLTGWTAQEVLGRNWLELFVPAEDRGTVSDIFNGLFAAVQGPWDVHYTSHIVTRSGARRTISWNTNLLRGSLGRPVAVTSIGEDITERLENEKAIRYLAYHDQLTELPNRSLFYDRVSQAIAHAQRDQEKLGILFIDLDYFKTVNDTMGHNTGDHLLRAIGQRMAALVRREDTLARTGGDEFVALIRSLDGAEDAAQSAQRILTALQEPFEIKGQEFLVSASIGVAVYPGNGEDVETLLKHADMAMYWAKENGRNRYQFFTPSMNEHVQQRSALDKSLKRALTNEEFAVYYQPIVDIRTGAILGLEALLRWNQPERGVVAPAEFIQLAEETGLIVPIGEWVLRSVCAQIRAWLEAGLPAYRVSVNLSALQFAQSDLVRLVHDALVSSEIDHSCLGLEITERVTMQDAALTVNTLSNLRRLGAKISLDDFGTGYSALSYLRQLPIDLIKLDKSFIHDLGIDGNARAIASAVIFLAHQLDLKVVAEGVEDVGQLAFLREQRCDAIQGYLCSRPLPAPEIERLLRIGSFQLPDQPIHNFI